MQIQQDIGLERAVLETTVLIVSDKFDEECFVESFIRLIFTYKQRALIIWHFAFFILLGCCRLLEHDYWLKLLVKGP